MVKKPTPINRLSEETKAFVKKADSKREPEDRLYRSNARYAKGGVVTPTTAKKK